MIRNSLFSIFFFVGIIIISIIFLPALLLPSQFTLIGGKLMGYWAGFCLRVFLSVKIIIKGKSGEAYNIGNPKPEISMLYLHKISEKILNKKIKIIKNRQKHVDLI